MYDFNTIIDRRGTGTVKTDALQEHFGRNDLAAHWVADMDFATPDFIVDALKQRISHPIFGYTTIPDEYWQCIIDWLSSHHDWNVKQDWLRYIPGIVKGIGMAVNALTNEGDSIIIQTPVYHPFRLVPEANHRRIVENPLTHLPDGSYAMDFDNLESIIDDSCKMLILSNPHNPAGIVWSADTLRRLAEICLKHGIIVISDEIHCDMALFGHRHTPFASVSPEAAKCSITFGAPSKTFNIAGIVSSYCIVPDDDLRERFYAWVDANEFDSPNLFAPIATIAAYSQGEQWRKQMLAYVDDNVRYVEEFCAEHIPGIKPMRPQASFLVWLDCRGLNLSHEQLIDLFVNKAKLALNDGAMFGAQGEGFMRLNVGTPRANLQDAFISLRNAITSLHNAIMQQ